MSWQETMAAELNTVFGPMLLPRGFILALIVDDGKRLRVNIGNKHASFDRSGKCVELGTAWIRDRKWKIERRRE